MVADYFGNVLIPAQTLEHQASFFQIAFALIREAQEKNKIKDLIASVERTGNYHFSELAASWIRFGENDRRTFASIRNGGFDWLIESIASRFGSNASSL